MQSKFEHLVVLPSHPDNVGQVAGYVENVIQLCEQRVSQEVYGKMLIAITEAVNNAIIHGNCRDVQKNVVLSSKMEHHTVTFMVEDEGKGFDIRAVPDPTLPENKCKCGGRGVFLMHQLTDEIQFKNNGRAVCMKFNLK